MAEQNSGPRPGKVLDAANHPQSHSHRPHRTTGLTTTSTPDQLEPRPRIRAQGRPTRDSGSQWLETNMTREELKELFNLVHETLEHVPYAICGLAALIDHGLTRRQATRISIICPQECKNNVKTWAVTQGHKAYIDSIGVSMRDGTTRRVRIKYVDYGFEGLERVRSNISNATILSVASQLDNVAAGYLENTARGDERALAIIAQDIFFALDLLASRRAHINPRFLPTFLGEKFSVDFTGQYAEARPEMARAGIDVRAVLEKHRTALALREHNAMLAQYGMGGDAVPAQSGQFEGIRDLRNSTSVYTLEDRNFGAEPGVSDLTGQHANNNSSRTGPSLRSSKPSPKSSSDRKVPTSTPGPSDTTRRRPKKPKP